MDIRIHSIRFDASDRLKNFINNKLDKLSILASGEILSSEVFLRLSKADDTENKISEIKLEVKGDTLFAKKQCKTFEEATDMAINALKKQLDKHRNKYK